MFNVIDSNLAASQVGLALGQAYMRNNLEYQRLRSEDALRKVEEQQMAQQTAFALAAHEKQIQYRADMEKAAGQFAVATATQGPPIVPVPSGMGPAGMPIMSPMPNTKYRDPVDIATDTFLPVISKYEPEKVPAFLREQAYSKYMNTRGGVAENVAGIRADATLGAAGIRAGAMENVAGIRTKSAEHIAAERLAESEKARADKAQHDFDVIAEKHKNTMELLDFKNAQQDKIEQMREKARMDIAKGETSGIQWVNRHLNTIAKDLGGTAAGARMSTQERIKTAESIAWDGWSRAKAQMSDSKTPAAPQAGPEPDIQDDQVWVVSPSGVKGKIPKDEFQKALKKGYKPFEG